MPLQLIECIISPLLAALTSLALFKVSRTDPGFLPVSDKPPHPSSLQGEDPGPHAMIKGVKTSLKFCTTCNTFRLPRSHHCRECNRCVRRLDHHCPWVRNCIGKLNHGFFVIFLLLSNVYGCFIMATCLAALADDVTIYGEILIVVLTGIMVWSLGGLTVYQLYLICKNMTTHEHLRRLFKAGNPYDERCKTNCWYFWKRGNEDFDICLN